LCKSWLSKKWKRTKKFVKKHKKAIIIGAVVVVAVAVVVTVAVCSAGAAAAAAGTTASSGGGNALAGAAAGVAAISANKNSKEEETCEEKRDIKLENSLVLLQEEQNEKDLEVARIFHENIDSCKEKITDDLVLAESIEHDGGIEDPSTLEKLQIFGSVLAHDIVDGVSEMTDFAPRLAEEIETVGKMILPEEMLNNGKLTESPSPIENFEEAFAKSHELIDAVFSTDLAKNSKSKYNEGAFNEELVSNIFPEPTLGILPPPSGIPKLFSNTNRLIKAGNVLDRAQFTKFGRGLMKHGYRKGSSFLNLMEILRRLMIKDNKF